MSLGTPKILSTVATLHLGPIRLHVENWACRENRQHGAKNLACRADFFLARVLMWFNKWGLRRTSLAVPGLSVLQRVDCKSNRGASRRERGGPHILT